MDSIDEVTLSTPLVALEPPIGPESEVAEKPVEVESQALCECVGIVSVIVSVVVYGDDEERPEDQPPPELTLLLRVAEVS